MDSEEIKILDITVRQNKAYIYILPMLFNTRYDVLIEELVNVYIRDINISDLDNNIFLVYRNNENNINLLNLYNKLKNHKNFILDYDYGNKYKVFVFDVPENYKTDYNLFLKGKYSSFSDKYKKHISNFHFLRHQDSVMDVLYKRENRYIELEKRLDVSHIPRNLDTSSIIDPRYEYLGNLTEEDIKEYENIKNLW